MESSSPSLDTSKDEDDEDEDASSSGDDCLSYLPFVIHDKKEEVVLV